MDIKDGYSWGLPSPARKVSNAIHLLNGERKQSRESAR